MVGAGGLVLLGACGGSSGSEQSTPPSSSGRSTPGASDPGRFSGQTLVVNGYGGEWEDLFTTVIKEPFEERYGVTITIDPSGSAAEDYAKLRASQGDPGWDVVVFTAQEPVQAAKEDLLLPITEDRVPNLANVFPALREVVGEYGVAHEVQYMSLMYNTDQFSTPPDSWSVFWDEANTGHILLFDPANIIGVFFLFMAAQVHGGNLENLEPGFAALEELKGRTVAIPISSADAVPYMERGDVWIMPYWDGRAGVYQSQGLPYDFVIPNEGSVALVNALAIPKGAPNPDLAYEFINFWLDPAIQSEWSQAYHVGPSQPNVSLPADFSEKHITSEEQLSQLIQPDYDFVAENRPQWTERWRRIFSN